MALQGEATILREDQQRRVSIEEKLPFQALPAFITKRQRAEAMSGAVQVQSDSVETPSLTALPPSAAARRPFKPPRKRRKLRLIADEVLSPSPLDGREPSPDPLSESDDDLVIDLGQ